MQLQIQTKQKISGESTKEISQHNDYVFSKDYVDFLSEAGWRLERKFPSNNSNYSDLLEDTEWKYSHSDFNTSKHYRRDLDALS